MKINFKKAAVALAVLGLLFVPVGKSLSAATDDWGPQNRPTFTWDNPATYVTFNSITNNPTVGDERRFYTANQVGVDDHEHSLSVKDGEEVTLRAYVHNNAASNLNLVAHNTRIKMTVPTGEATDQQSVATISADNANPGAVFDSVHLTGSKAFSLEYEQGSAKLFNNVFTNGTSLGDDITSGNGTLIGYDKMDGNLPGCNQFSAWVTIKVKVHVPPPQQKQPTFTCDAFNITSDVNRTVKVSTFSTTQTNGATFKNAVVDWGDNSAQLTDSNIVGKTHQYGKDGTFTITATAHFDVNGQDKTASGPNCVKQVSFTSPNTPPTVTTPPSPAAPTQLVNTGPGQVAGIFGAVTAAGAIAHRYMLGRRLSRQ